MGNEAIALGAVKAGVNFVCGYPGTPSTEVLETIAKKNTGDIFVEWSINEKAAMEAAAGASYAGARVLMTCKQVGLNVAADPLMSLSYIGTNGGMVILVADDPGPISSQNEQDTRHFGKFSNLPVLDPSSPEEAFEMVQYAFELSEKMKLPVFLRPTTRICHACASIEVNEDKYIHTADGFKKDPKWVIFPALAYKNHVMLEQKQNEMSELFSTLSYNSVTGEGEIGIAAGGVTYSYVKEAIKNFGINAKVLKVGTPYPFPEKLALNFLEGLKKVIVLEELDAVIEDSLIYLCGKKHINCNIFGKNTLSVPNAGEFSVEIAEKSLAEFFEINYKKDIPNADIPLPFRPPVLCAGCPHRASFYACKIALKGQKAVYSGDIGCYTLGNAKPLDMVDTCLCMGAGITIAQGLHEIENDTKNLAFIGDSTFFASGITGIINAVYNNHDITVIILDNSTTAMTGHQPHPGTGMNLMKSPTECVNIEAVLKGCGVKFIRTEDPLDLESSVKAVKEATEFNGVSAVIFKSPCIALFKPVKKYQINDKCIKCKKCIREVGCPAISTDSNKVTIDSTLCTGCGLCSQICPCEAIEEVSL